MIFTQSATLWEQKQTHSCTDKHLHNSIKSTTSLISAKEQINISGTGRKTRQTIKHLWTSIFWFAIHRMPSHINMPVPFISLTVRSHDSLSTAPEGKQVYKASQDGRPGCWAENATQKHNTQPIRSLLCHNRCLYWLAAHPDEFVSPV